MPKAYPDVEEKPTLDEIVDEKSFTNPETGNAVKLHSLPPAERRKQRKKIRKEINKQLKETIKVASLIAKDIAKF